MKMELPKEKITAITKNPKLLFLYGPEKVGKTTVLSMLEDNLIIDTEDGSDYVKALKIKANSISDLREIIKELKKEGTPSYKYVSIDTLDKIEEWAEDIAKIDYMNSPMGKNFVGDSILTLPKGSGYFWLRQAFFRIFNTLAKIAPNVILVGHIKETSVEKEGKEVDSKDINLTGKIKQMVAAKSDAIGYLFRDSMDSKKLMITFNTKDEIRCGSRCKHLYGQTFEFDWSKIMIDK